MDSAAIIAINAVTVGISTGILLWKGGAKIGSLDEIAVDHQRQLNRLADESATRREMNSMQEAYQDAVAGLVKTVDQRMKSVEDMVGRRFEACETQISELRQHLMRPNGGGK